MSKAVSIHKLRVKACSIILNCEIALPVHCTTSNVVATWLM